MHGQFYRYTRHIHMQVNRGYYLVCMPSTGNNKKEEISGSMNYTHNRKPVGQQSKILFM